VEARDQPGWLLGLARGHAHVDRTLGLGGKESLRLTLCRAVSGRERYGGEYVPRVVGLVGLCQRYRPGEPAHGATERARTGRPGHGGHDAAKEGEMPLVPGTHILGKRCRLRFCSSEYCALVDDPEPSGNYRFRIRLVMGSGFTCRRGTLGRRARV
jgi:hypothetical protein